MLGYTACRTKFFDDYFLAAAGDGVRQAVILAAGLDSRAWRLAWPAGCVVYEIDQPKVLAFKTGTLESHAVSPVVSHVSVGIDLRLDWPTALAQAGFDASVPTAWSAEGLLPYLTADAQNLLFDRIQSLSAPGSRVAVEAFTNEFFSSDSFARREEQMDRYRLAAVKLGGKDITESGNLLYEGERTEVVDWLRTHGWSVTAATSADDLMAASNRAIPAGPTPQSRKACSSKADCTDRRVGSRTSGTPQLRCVIGYQSLAGSGLASLSASGVAPTLSDPAPALVTSTSASPSST